MSDRYIVYIKDQKIIASGQSREKTTENRKRTRFNQSRRSSRVHTTIHSSIQQKEIQKVTRKKRMGPWNQLNRRHAKKTKYKGLYNDDQGEQSIKPIVRWTAQGKINSWIKFKICGTMFLYSKKGQITTVGTRLQKTKPIHNKGQNATTLN